MKKRIIIICVVAVLCGVAVFLVASASTSTEYDVSWQMYGTLITEDGIVDKKMDFSVAGTLIDHHEPGEYDRFGIDALFPEDFRYYLDRNLDKCWNNLSNPRIWGSLNHSYDKELYMYVATMYAFDLDKEYFILQGYQNDLLLVGSTDPDTDPAEILEHFSEFIEQNKEYIEKPMIVVN